MDAPPGDWLFQTKLRVEANSGKAVFLPSRDVLDDGYDETDDERRRLDLQYRHRLEFAIGRTASVTWTDITPYLTKLNEYRFKTPEERGELRLVAWAPDPQGGQKMEPKIDRHRGFRLVVVHLKYAPPPSPAAPEYFSPPKPVASAREHREIITAIRKGDAAAARQAARNHRQRARDQILPLIARLNLRNL